MCGCSSTSLIPKVLYTPPVPVYSGPCKYTKQELEDTLVLTESSLPDRNNPQYNTFIFKISILKSAIAFYDKNCNEFSHIL